MRLPSNVLHNVTVSVCATANIDPSEDHAASTGTNDRYVSDVRHRQASPSYDQILIRPSVDVVNNTGESTAGEKLIDVMGESCGRSTRVDRLNDGSPALRCQSLRCLAGVNVPFDQESSVAIQVVGRAGPGRENATSSTRVGSKGMSAALDTRFEGATSISSVWASSDGE